MKDLIRNCAAIAVGVVVGGVVNMAFILLGSYLVPPPAGVDVTSAESIAESVHLFEPSHFLFPFLAHALGTLVGAFLAVKIAPSRGRALALIVGVVFLAGGIANAFMIPAPGWFVALDLVVAYLPMAWLGSMGARPGSQEDAP